MKRGPYRTDQGVHEFTIQKPYCSPARGYLLTAFEPYNIPMLDYHEEVKKANLLAIPRLMMMPTEEHESYGAMIERMAFPKAQEATFTVPAQAAEWAEYLIERTQRFVIIRGVVNAKNQEYGRRHGGLMPRAWGEQPDRQPTRRRRKRGGFLATLKGLW